MRNHGKVTNTMADILSVKIQPATMGRIRNFQSHLKSFIGPKLGDGRQIQLENQLCLVISKEEKIREKIGSMEDEVVEVTMCAKKVGNTIQLHGMETLNNLPIELKITLFKGIPQDFQKQMEKAKLGLNTRILEISFRIFDVLLKSEGHLLNWIKQNKITSWITDKSVKKRMKKAERESRVEIPENKKSEGKLENFYLSEEEISGF
jgi:hypothetical protein